MGLENAPFKCYLVKNWAYLVKMHFATSRHAILQSWRCVFANVTRRVCTIANLQFLGRVYFQGAPVANVAAVASFCTPCMVALPVCESQIRSSAEIALKRARVISGEPLAISPIKRDGITYLALLTKWMIPKGKQQNI